MELLPAQDAHGNLLGLWAGCGNVMHYTKLIAAKLEQHVQPQKKERTASLRRATGPIRFSMWRRILCKCPCRPFWAADPGLSTTLSSNSAFFSSVSRYCVCAAMTVSRSVAAYTKRALL